MRKFLIRRSLRNIVQLWRATSGDLALHDAEYCADAKINGSRVNGHKLAPTEN